MQWSDVGIELPVNAKGQVKAQCPKCRSERRKHPHDKPLSVNVDEGVWKCHHCGWDGSLKEGGNGFYIPKPKIFRRPEKYDVAPPGDKIVNWFAARKISRNVVERNKITYVKHFMPQTKNDETCIAFPYFRDGEIINIKYRDAKKNFCQEKDAEPIVFKFDDIAGQEEIGICEGEIDSLSFETIGLLNFCSVPNGAPNENDKKVDGKLEFLDSISAIIENAKKVIIAVDNDAPGRRLEEELARRIGKEKCWRIEYPEGCKDANDVLVKHGQEGLHKCYTSAKPYPIDGLITFYDIVDEIGDIYINGYKRGLSTGWKELDEFYTVRAGEVTVITGEPGAGKSSFLDALIMNLAKNNDWRFTMYSPENYPPARYFTSLAEKFICKPFHRGINERISPDELDGAIKWIGERFYPIVSKDDDGLTIDEIFSLARAAIFRFGVNGVIIDPYNELEHNIPQGITETQYVSKLMSKARRFSRSNNIHLWIVAHPTKMHRNKNGEYPRVTLYDISGSAHFYNKTDNGIVISRDPLIVDVQKVRFREIGKRGECGLEYDRVTGTIKSRRGASAAGENTKELWYKEKEPEREFPF